MADFKTPSNLPTGANTENPPQYKIDVADKNEAPISDDGVDYSERAQWLRAAVLGANDGLVSVSSIMMGIGAVKEDHKTMFLAGFAGLVAGACSMAIGEFVSVSTQLDVEKAKRKRNAAVTHKDVLKDDDDEPLPNPAQAALASALAFVVGGIMPLFVAAFVTSYQARVPSMIGVASLALVVFGVIGAMLGKSPIFKSCVRVLIGGWMAMAVTFGITKLVHTGGVEM